MGAIVNLKNTYEDFAVEFEVLPPVDITEKLDERQKRIVDGIASIDEQLAENQKVLDSLNSEIERLTNHADGLDYMIAVGSGIIAGVIDIMFVDDLSFEQAYDWGQEKTDKFVVKVAKWQGYKGDDVDGAIKYLAEGKKHKGGEKKGFHLASDSNTSQYGGGKQHHLRDFAHHPTLVGLCFSMLTQFTSKAYGTDTNGFFLVVDINDKEFIGDDLPHKLLYGIIFWFFHMISDVAGSGGTKNGGTGLPGPIGSFLKEISVLPIFSKLDDKGNKEFSKWISKLFNGTLLGERDGNGKLQPIKFDLRTEIGLLPQLANQALPIIINECVVRGFYFFRRLYHELKEKQIHSIADLKNINWKNTLPFRNRTVIRMLTISTGTMTAIDLADAAIESAVKSGGVNAVGFVKNMIVKVNFVGIGRFAIAVGSDVSMGMKRSKLRNERIVAMNEQIFLMNGKTFYKQAEMWIAAESVEETLEEAYTLMEETVKTYAKAYADMKSDLKKIGTYITGIEEKNVGLLEEMNDILKWE